MNERWYMTLFRPGRENDAMMLGHLRDGDPAVEAAADRVEAGRRLAQEPSLPEHAGARRRGAGGVPFSAASGQDLSPFGDDFGTWSDTVAAHRRRPLPDYMREQPEAEPEPPRRGLEPESANVPGFNSDMEMRSAMARARSSERVRAGTPTVADSIFLLIFGGKSPQERANAELREDVEARRRN